MANEPNPYVTEAEARAQAAAAQTSDGSSTGSQPNSNSDVRPVVAGYAHYQSGGYSGIPTSANRVPQLSTVFDYRQTLSQMRATTPKQYAALLDQMRAAGYLGPRSTAMSSIETAWNTVLEDAAALYQNKPGAKNLSVWDFLYSRAVKGAEQSGGNGPGGSSGGGSSSGGPFTNTTVQLTNQFDARALVDSALNQYLGRDAKPKERAAFLAQLNGTEMANPQVDSGSTGPSGTTRVASGGIGAAGAGVLAEDFAKSRDNYAETQASTTLLSRMEKLIMGDTTGGM